MKYIAFLSMFIDHTNKALIYPNLDGGALNRLSDFFDILGRIAFPIFIFLLVEGYFHTSTKWRYLVTLLVFGVISEVPFDMCTSARFVEINWNNIMFTLALVLAMIWVIDVLKEKMASLPKALWYFVSFLIVAVLCIVAMNASLDYEHHAVLIGYFCYIIPMTDDVYEAFQNIVKARPKLKVEPMIDGYSGFLCFDKDNKPMVAMHWEKYFQHAVDRYNSIYRVQLPKITPHVCRHTYCSNMAKSGMNPKVLQYLMGHSDISVTLNTYTHLKIDDAKEEMEKLAKAQAATEEISKANGQEKKLKDKGWKMA